MNLYRLGLLAIDICGSLGCIQAYGQGQDGLAERLALLQLQNGNGMMGNQAAAMLRAQQQAAVQPGNDNGNAQIIQLLTALLRQKVNYICIAWGKPALEANVPTLPSMPALKAFLGRLICPMYILCNHGLWLRFKCMSFAAT